MSMMIAAVMMLGMAQDDIFTKGAHRLSVADEHPAKPRSPYRIDPSLASGPNAKDRAFAEDGRRCQVVGSRMCTKPPRTLKAPGITAVVHFGAPERALGRDRRAWSQALHAAVDALRHG